MSRPHRTLLYLSVPVLLSLIAEPLTGLVDTAFVARVGSAASAGLGVGAIALSSVFWIFNFLGIGTQTEVARHFGAGSADPAREAGWLALLLGVLFGAIVGLAMALLATPSARLLGAEGDVLDAATVYLRIRALAAPSVLVTTAAFGALRGLQDMKIPLFIAVLVNALNILLDAILVLGWGPFPALGIAGAAWATVISQTLGALLAVVLVLRRLGPPTRPHLRHAVRLFVVGRDLVLRTSLLTLFLLLATRSATALSSDAGAAHQAIRQVWLFTALVLDAYAATAQSLVGFFLGANTPDQARRVAAISCGWGLVTGALMTALMLATGKWLGLLLVPEAARTEFARPWLYAALFQPLNAVSFVTDGIHWGTSDYRYLRNAMALATLAGALILWILESGEGFSLTQVWIVTGIWITLRAIAGLVRIWPGSAGSPLGRRRVAWT